MIISTNDVLFDEIQSETLVVAVSKHAENTTKWEAFCNPGLVANPAMHGPLTSMRKATWG